MRLCIPSTVLKILPSTFFRFRRAFWVRSCGAALLLLGLLCFRDYGVSWDEETLRTNGMVSAKYVAGRLAPAWTARQAKFAHLPALAGYRDADHGVLFELPVLAAARLLGVADSRAYYLLRHLAVFLVFVVGAAALYGLGRCRLGSWRGGLLVSAALVLSPRFFAEAFYNAGDIVFLALFTLGVLTLVRLLRRPTLGRAAAHGLATAAAVDVRVLGGLLVAFTLGMVALELGFGTPPGAAGQPRRAALLRAGALYLPVAALAAVAGWPYLWEAPVPRLLAVVQRLSSYPWTGHVLYLGRSVAAQHLPWHYAPVWMLVTTPLAYTGAFVVGAGGALGALLRRGGGQLRTFGGRLDVLLLAWLAGPLGLVVGLHSVMYDGWRHLYFVYPALLLLAGRGAQRVWQLRAQGPRPRRLAGALAATAGLSVAATAVQMVAAHPQQQVYFAGLPPAAAERLFERDYWGLSYRQGLEWIARHDGAAHLDVAGQSAGLIEKNLALVVPRDRARFRLVGAAQARYYLSAYRNHPAPYPDSLGPEVYQVRAYGMRVLSVFRRPGRL